MSQLVSLPIKRAFFLETDNGKVFYWLRYLSDLGVEAAINEALQIVFLPTSLGDNANDLARVPLMREQSKQNFERWMTATTEFTAPTKGPKRVYIDCQLQFPQQSDHGKALKWIQEFYGKSAASEIVSVIQLVYLPVALSAFPDQEHRIPKVVTRSYLEFKNRRGYDVQPVVQEPLILSTNGRAHNPVTDSKSLEIRGYESANHNVQTQTLEKEKPAENEAYLGEEFFEIDQDEIDDDEE